MRPSSGTPGVETAPVLSSSSAAVLCVSAERSARTEGGGDEVMTITCLVTVVVAPATVPARSDIPYFRPPCGRDDNYNSCAAIHHRCVGTPEHNCS